MATRELEDRGHHPLVLMLEDVAVPDIFARERRNRKPESDAPISRNKGHILRGDIVAPCKFRIRRQLGINHDPTYLRHDEVALVDVEGVIERTSIHNRPFLN